MERFVIRAEGRGRASGDQDASKQASCIALDHTHLWQSSVWPTMLTERAVKPGCGYQGERILMRALGRVAKEQELLVLF